MEEPLVSVIMISYNHELFIEEAIRSVVLQKTDFPFELIIADDASTDRTAEIAEKWQKRYPDIIKLIRREKNLGLQANFLDAYSNAKGRYIAICESDDHWCSGKKLARQVAFLESHPECSVCFHRVVNHYADRHTKSLSNPHQKAWLTLAELSKGNVITNVSVMYRRIPANELPPWLKEIKLFDYALHSLHAERGEIGYLKRPMAVYRRHGRGIWSSNLRKGWELAMDVREHLISHFSVTQPDATRNLLNSYIDIGAALTADYMSAGDEVNANKTIERLKTTVRKYGTDISEDKVDKKLTDRLTAVKNTNKSLQIKKLLSATRGFVSRFVPVPRIR